MQRIFLDEAKPSMVLAAAVKDELNNILFLRGAELTEKHIGIMKSKNICKVVVEGSPVRKKGGEAAKAVEKRFSSAGDSALALKIRDMLKELSE
jgi:hypothetical protein